MSDSRYQGEYHLYLGDEHIGSGRLQDADIEWGDISSTVHSVDLEGLCSDLPIGFHTPLVSKPPENPDSPVGKITWIMVV